MFPFTRYLWLLCYSQFAYDANFQTAANTKDYDEFKYLGEQLAFSLHTAVYNFCNFLGS